MARFSMLSLLLASLAALATAQSYNDDNSTCPYPITSPRILGCNGCTKTIFPTTSTKSIDCQGCDSVATQTPPWKHGPACRRFVCIGGVQTTTAEAGAATTVTSCLSSQTATATSPIEATSS